MGLFDKLTTERDGQGDPMDAPVHGDADRESAPGDGESSEG